MTIVTTTTYPPPFTTTHPQPFTAPFFSSANMPLAEEIAARLGVPLTVAEIGLFNDGECNIQIMENIRGTDVFIVQPTCPPVNDNLMQLLLLISAARRASAARVTAIVPYYG